MLDFEITKRTDPRLLERMQYHYSQPKGFVGRNICMAIYYADVYYGHIVYGSATRFLPGRNEFFNITLNNLNLIANNLFFNISKVNATYPCHNFTSKVVLASIKHLIPIWYDKYGDKLIGIETLIEKPRTGELYRRAGFSLLGETKGFTCKRIAGQGTDAWTGRRIWDIDNLRPKLVFGYLITSNAR